MRCIHPDDHNRRPKPYRNPIDIRAAVDESIVGRHWNLFEGRGETRCLFCRRPLLLCRWWEPLRTGNKNLQSGDNRVHILAIKCNCPISSPLKKGKRRLDICYFLKREIYSKLTDNWLEATVHRLIYREFDHWRPQKYWNPTNCHERPRESSIRRF